MLLPEVSIIITRTMNTASKGSPANLQDVVLLSGKRRVVSADAPGVREIFIDSGLSPEDSFLVYLKKGDKDIINSKVGVVKTTKKQNKFGIKEGDKIEFSGLTVVAKKFRPYSINISNKETEVFCTFN